MSENNQEKTYPFALKENVVLRGRYRIKKVIGKGGFGITYEGYDLLNKEKCAVKELFINESVRRENDGKTVAAEEGKEKIFRHGIKRFTEEAEILHRLNGTPYVVNITDLFAENNTAYFVMEYIDGRPLNRVMTEKGGTMPFEEAEKIIYKVGMTLGHIYDRYSIFHRDLSPDNILLDYRGEPKIIDFGNAKTDVKHSGQVHSIVLKPGFAPPEQYTGRAQGPWTDVYSLAGVFYYITSGIKVPPAADRLMGAGYEPLYRLIEGCPKEISDAVDRGLALNYKERTKNAAELVALMKQPDSRHQSTPPNREKQSYSGGVAEKPSSEVQTIPSDSVQSNGRSQLPLFPIIRLEVINRGLTENWRLPPDTDIILGRDGKMCNVVVSADCQISKQHCVIRYDSSERIFKVTDISTNGTVVGDRRLSRDVTFRAAAGTQLILGGVCVVRPYISN